MVHETQLKTVITYVDQYGNEPFKDWLAHLKDIRGRQKIETRIRRLEAGLYGDCEPVGEGVSELRIFYGPGYRVYFGEENNNLVILLCGGDKSSQNRDIKQAKTFWEDYKNGS